MIQFLACLVRIYEADAGPLNRYHLRTVHGLTDKEISLLMVLAEED